MKTATSYSFTNCYSEFQTMVSQIPISYWISTTKNFFLKNPKQSKKKCAILLPLIPVFWIYIYTKTPDTVSTAKIHSKLFWYRNCISHFTATRLLLGVFSRTYYLTAKALSMISSFLIVRYAYSATCTPTPILILSIFRHNNYSNVKSIFHLILEIYMLVKLVSI